jgi:hypothetical protein
MMFITHPSSMFGTGRRVPAVAATFTMLAFGLLATFPLEVCMVPEALGEPTAGGSAPGARPVLRFHLAEVESIPGVRAVEAPGMGFKLWPRPDVILSEAHVDSVLAGYGDFSLRIRLKLDAEGQQRVREATRDNVGRFVVVFVADQFIMAPRIQAEINTDDLLIEDAHHTEEQWDAFLDRLAEAGVAVVRFAETPGEVGQDLPTPEESRRQLLEGWEDLRGRLDALGGQYSRQHLEFVGPMRELAMHLGMNHQEIDAAREIALSMEQIVRARLGRDGEEIILPLYGTLEDLCDYDLHERAASLLHEFLAEIAKPEWQAWPSRLPPEFFIRPLANHWSRQGEIDRAERLYESILAGPSWFAVQGFRPYLDFVRDQGRSESLRRQCRVWQARAEADTLYGKGWRQMADKGWEALKDLTEGE